MTPDPHPAEQQDDEPVDAARDPAEPTEAEEEAARLGDFA